MNNNLTNAANVFAKNAEVKELFFTSDGQCFYKKGPALVHQKEIKAAEDGIETIDAGDLHLESESESDEVVKTESPKVGKAKSKKKDTE